MVDALAFVGRARYTPDLPSDGGRLLVAVRIRFPGRRDDFHTLLDTGSEWCVVSTQVLDYLGLGPAIAGISAVYSTRYGKMRGHVCRQQVVLLADEGKDVTVDATIFASEEWPGPNVIGWKGCLERLRIGLDPETESFFFGAP